MKHESESFTIYLGDCYDLLPEIMETAQPGSVIMDPPYIVSTQGGPTFGRKRSYKEKIHEKNLHAGFDHAVFADLKAADSLMVFCHNDQLENLLPLSTGLEYERMALLSWHKDNPMPVANKHYLPDTEFIVHFWRSGGHPKGQLCEKGRYILGAVGKNDFAFINGDGESEKHPTVKPQYVMQWLVANGSEAGETILDPFMGTGSTGVAAIRHGRRFIGIERDENYFKIALKRLQEAEKQKNLF